MTVLPAVTTDKGLATGIVERTRPDGWLPLYVAALVVLDVVTAAVGGVLALRLQIGVTEPVRPDGVLDQGHLALVVGGALVWAGALGVGGVYERRRLGNGSDEYKRIIDVGSRLVALVAIASLALRSETGRSLVLVALPLATASTVAAHYCARRWLHAQRAAGACAHRVLVVGDEAAVADLVRHLDRSSYAGLSVVGACVPGRADWLDVDGRRVPVVGRPAEVLHGIGAARADTVAVADQRAFHNGALRQLGWQLEGRGIDLLVAPSVVDVAGPRIAVRPVAGLPLLHVEEPALGGLSRLAKDAVDRVAAAVLLLVLLPLLVAVGLAVRLTSRGPALFKQVRVGQHGQEFTLYKFRTMRATAEQELPVLVDRNEHDGPLFKIRLDPRRTALGQRLRRWSIDELPQLWNVVAGHMSIVGPRPPLPREVEGFSPEARRRLLVKPGLTGLWQVSGRANLPWDEAVRLDLYYVENWSPALDFVILAKTVTAVLRGRGAY